MQVHGHYRVFDAEVVRSGTGGRGGEAAQLWYSMRDDGSGSGGGVTDGESQEQVEGRGENKYNRRVCSGSQGLIWVGYWGDRR